jgi:uncharacterized membrane protein
VCVSVCVCVCARVCVCVFENVCDFVYVLDHASHTGMATLLVVDYVCVFYICVCSGPDVLDQMSGPDVLDHASRTGVAAMLVVGCVYGYVFVCAHTHTHLLALRLCVNV